MRSLGRALLGALLPELISCFVIGIFDRHESLASVRKVTAEIHSTGSFQLVFIDEPSEEIQGLVLRKDVGCPCETARFITPNDIKVGSAGLETTRLDYTVGGNVTQVGLGAVVAKGNRASGDRSGAVPYVHNLESNMEGIIDDFGLDNLQEMNFQKRPVRGEKFLSREIGRSFCRFCRYSSGPVRADQETDLNCGDSNERAGKHSKYRSESGYRVGLRLLPKGFGLFLLGCACFGLLFGGGISWLAIWAGRK